MRDKKKYWFHGTVAAGFVLVTALYMPTVAQQIVMTSPEKTRAASQAEGSVEMLTAHSFRKDYVRPTEIPFPEENPYSEEKERLGKMLFFDPRLSRAGMQSCASCHNPSFAWGDGLPKGVGDGMKELKRRTPTILNAAWGEIFMWDGRKDTLEEQALGPIEADVEMNLPIDKLLERLNGIKEYKELFAAAFPQNPEISADNIAMAIATYERTVVSGKAPFDRWIEGEEGAISEAAKRGFALFNTKGQCMQCHSSWRFSDDSFHDIGLPDADIGRAEFLPDLEKMQHAFKTPGLRNIDRRGPFMHDGSLADLRAVIVHYNDGGVDRPSRSNEIKPLGLNDREINDLVAFLETLTSDDPPISLTALPR